MSVTLRRYVPLTMASIVAAMMVFEYYFKTTWGPQLAGMARNVSVIAVGYTFVLAFVVQSIRHVRILTEKRSKWPYSALLLVVLWGMTALGLAYGARDKWFQWVFSNINPIVYGAMIGTTAFFVASAGYRALRIRSIEGTLMLVTGALVIIGQVTLGEAIWGNFGPLSNWILDVAQSAGMRGLEITIGFGFVAMCMRIMAWMDTRWLGE